MYVYVCVYLFLRGIWCGYKQQNTIIHSQAHIYFSLAAHIQLVHKFIFILTIKHRRMRRCSHKQICMHLHTHTHTYTQAYMHADIYTHANTNTLTYTCQLHMKYFLFYKTELKQHLVNVKWHLHNCSLVYLPQTNFIATANRKQKITFAKLNNDSIACPFFVSWFFNGSFPATFCKHKAEHIKIYYNNFNIEKIYAILKC